MVLLPAIAMAWFGWPVRRPLRTSQSQRTEPTPAIPNDDFGQAARFATMTRSPFVSPRHPIIRKLTAPSLGLVVLFIASAVSGQTPAVPAGQPTAPGLRKLTGDDARRAAELDKAIAAALEADRWGEAIARAEELHALRARALGPRHFETVSEEWRQKTLRRLAAMPHEDRVAYQSAGSLTAQGTVLWRQGKYAQAQQRHEKALEIYRRLLTDDHPDTATIYNNLALSLDAQGKYAQAQPLFEKALEIDRRLLTDDHPDTATSYNNLALNLDAQRKSAQAQPLNEKALEIRRRLLTDDHPLTASSYNSVAMNLNAQGKYAQAQQLFEKALEIDRRLLSDDDPATALAYNNVAYNLNAQGKYAQAQPLFEKALEIYRRLLTDDQPQTAQGYNNVAANLNAQGKYAQAQPLYEKALEIYRRLLTDDHPNTAQVYNNVAANLNAEGKYAQAQPLFEKALEIWRRLLTDDHPYTAASYNNLAGNLNAQGKYAQAQPLYEKALEIRRRLLTDDHPDTANSYNNVAFNLNAQGKYAQAQPLHEKALEIDRRLLTDDHPDTARDYNNVAHNLNAQGKYTQAQPLYEKALEIRRRLLTDDHPDTANSYNNVAFNLNAQGKYAQAQPLHEKALEIERRLLTDDHPITALGYDNLAGNLSAQGKYLEARDQWLRGVKSLDSARLAAAFTGLERAGTRRFTRAALAAVLARLGQPAEAWQRLEEDLGRGLLDELAARQDQRLTPAQRARLRELTAELERLDKLVETTPKNLDEAERDRRFEDLKRQRVLASIALGEFQTKLVADYGPLAGQVATLNEIQAGLPADAALVAWVDINPVGPNAADPDGEHWGVVVRSRGIPGWIAIAGTGPNGLWTKDDDDLGSRARTELRSRPGAGRGDSGPGRGVTHPGGRAAAAREAPRPTPRAAVEGPGRHGRRPAAGAMADCPSIPGHGGHPDRGPARARRHSYSQLRSVGDRVQVPARAAPARPPCRPLGPGRSGLRASRQVERAQATARSRPAGERGGARLQRRDPRFEARRCFAGLQRGGPAQTRGLESRCRARPAGSGRGLAGGPGDQTRIGRRQARRGPRHPAGTGRYRRAA